MTSEFQERAQENPYRAPQTQTRKHDPAESAPQHAWRDDPYLCLRRHGSVLPDRCLLCNEPAVGRMAFTVWDRSNSPWMLLAVWMIVGPLCLLFLERARVKLWLCDGHWNKEGQSRRITRAIILSGFGLLLLPLALDRWTKDNPAAVEWGIWLVILGFVLLLTAFGWAILRPKLLRAKRVDQYYVWLENASPAYLAAFPPIATANQPQTPSFAPANDIG